MGDECFYVEDGEKKDSAIHDEILKGGSIPRASSVSISKKIGLTDAECAAIFKKEVEKAFNPDEPRDDHGRWTASGSYKEHSAVNDWLRGDRSPASGSKKENERLIAELDRAIATNSLDRDTVLYRGFGDISILDSIKNGTYRDKAYFSASTDEAVARAIFGDGYVAKIVAPKGTPALRYSDDYQSEVVLARGSSFKVVGIDHQSKTVNLKLK